MHLRAVNLWIDAVGFELFERGGDGNIERDRILIQRATRLNPLSKELWLQYFALKSQCLMKFVGRAIVFYLEPQPNLSMKAQIVLRNAIKEIPDSVNFRLELLRICGIFPFDSVKDIDDGLNYGIFNDFKKRR